MASHSVKESTTKLSPEQRAQTNELQRCVKLRGLPLSVLYDRVNFESKVRELLLGTFALKPEHILSVTRLAVVQDGKEAEVEALVHCASRIQKNLIYQSREKLAAPISVHPASADEKLPSNMPRPGSSVSEETMGDKNEDGFVVESISNDNATDLDTERQEEVDYEEEGMEQGNEVEEDGDPRGIRDSKGGDRLTGGGNEDRIGGGEDTMKAEESVEGGEDEEERKEHLKDCLDANQTEEDPDEPEDDEAKDHEGHEEDNRGDREDDPPPPPSRPRFQKVWEGAPEFQWKSVKGADEWCRLVVDNVSMADLQNPFIYQSLIRARSVNLNFINASVKGSYDHQLFRKGRLTMTFISDTQAMAQAVNGLVFVRTPPHRPRLKVLLPQTSLTMQMKHLLEMKLGRVLEPHDKSRRLLVREIGESVTEEQIRETVKHPENLAHLRIVKDCLDRQCAILEYEKPEWAIEAHLGADVLPLGEADKRGQLRHVKVFFMEDFVEEQWVLKPEWKMIQDRRPDHEEGGGPRPSRPPASPYRGTPLSDRKRARTRSPSNSSPERHKRPGRHQRLQEEEPRGPRARYDPNTRANPPFRDNRHYSDRGRGGGRGRGRGSYDDRPHYDRRSRGRGEDTRGRGGYRGRGGGNPRYGDSRRGFEDRAPPIRDDRGTGGVEVLDVRQDLIVQQQMIQQQTQQIKAQQEILAQLLNEQRGGSGGRTGAGADPAYALPAGGSGAGTGSGYSRLGYGASSSYGTTTGTSRTPLPITKSYKKSTGQKSSSRSYNSGSGAGGGGYSSSYPSSYSSRR